MLGQCLHGFRGNSALTAVHMKFDSHLYLGADKTYVSGRFAACKNNGFALSGIQTLGQLKILRNLFSCDLIWV